MYWFLYHDNLDDILAALRCIRIKSENEYGIEKGYEIRMNNFEYQFLLDKADDLATKLKRSSEMME